MIIHIWISYSPKGLVRFWPYCEVHVLRFPRSMVTLLDRALSDSAKLRNPTIVVSPHKLTIRIFERGSIHKSQETASQKIMFKSLALATLLAASAANVSATIDHIGTKFLDTCNTCVFVEAPRPLTLIFTWIQRPATLSSTWC